MTQAGQARAFGTHLSPLRRSEKDRTIALLLRQVILRTVEGAALPVLVATLGGSFVQTPDHLVDLPSDDQLVRGSTN